MRGGLGIKNLAPRRWKKSASAPERGGTSGGGETKGNPKEPDISLSQKLRFPRAGGHGQGEHGGGVWGYAPPLFDKLCRPVISVGRGKTNLRRGQTFVVAVRTTLCGLISFLKKWREYGNTHPMLQWAFERIRRNFEDVGGSDLPRQRKHCMGK